jgi:hypothetical protein
MALLLLNSSVKGIAMSRTQWLLLGAALMGIAIVVYLIFFCPTECH